MTNFAQIYLICMTTGNRLDVCNTRFYEEEDLRDFMDEHRLNYIDNCLSKDIPVEPDFIEVHYKTFEGV